MLKEWQAVSTRFSQPLPLPLRNCRTFNKQYLCNQQKRETWVVYGEMVLRWEVTEVQHADQGPLSCTGL